MDRKLQIVTDNNGTDVTKTVTHVNTDMTDSDCVTFAESFNALSANRLKQVTRIDKVKITDAQ